MKIVAILALVALFAAPLNCKTLKPFIIGGEDAERNFVPFQVEIRVVGWLLTLELRCSGIILSKNVILTTARCAQQDSPEYTYVVAGDPEGNREENSEGVYRVGRIIVHPGWDHRSDTNENDVAVLILEKDLELSPGKIEIAPLSVSDDEINSGDTGMVTGWGNVAEGDDNEPEILQKIALTVASNVNCRRKFGENLITPEEHFCAGSASGSVCDGDQGSPFIIFDGAVPPTQTVYGLVSNVKYCSNDPVGTLFIKLGPHLDWISEQLDPSGTTEVPTTITKEQPSTVKDDTTLGTSTEGVPSSELPTSQNPVPSEGTTETPVNPTTNGGLTAKGLGFFIWIISFIAILHAFGK